MPHAEAVQQLRDRHAGSARSVEDDPKVPHRPARQPGGVQETRGNDDRGAVLVVMKHGDVECRLQPVLDVKAGRRGDVLQIDRPEHRRHERHGFHELVRIFRVEHDRE